MGWVTSVCLDSVRRGIFEDKVRFSLGQVQYGFGEDAVTPCRGGGGKGESVGSLIKSTYSIGIESLQANQLPRCRIND